MAKPWNSRFYAKMMEHALCMFSLDMADLLLSGSPDADAPAKGKPRATKIFSQFISLLHADYCKHHTAEHYAQTLCVTLQYLNRVVRQQSQKTVLEWVGLMIVDDINRRMEAEEPLKSIAATLCFANTAALTKFYKRRTGHSLRTYKSRRALP